MPLLMDVMHDHGLKVTFHLEPYADTRAQSYADDVLYLIREYGDKRALGRPTGAGRRRRARGPGLQVVCDDPAVRSHRLPRSHEPRCRCGRRSPRGAIRPTRCARRCVATSIACCFWPTPATSAASGPPDSTARPSTTASSGRPRGPRWPACTPTTSCSFRSTSTPASTASSRVPWSPTAAIRPCPSSRRPRWSGAGCAGASARRRPRWRASPSRRRPPSDSRSTRR